jgi:hypothetical protein
MAHGYILDRTMEDRISLFVLPGHDKLIAEPIDDLGGPKASFPSCTNT